ncbi:MAG: hypothetical protein AAFQ87_27030 [Bacteroidota bacterium]
MYHDLLTHSPTTAFNLQEIDATGQVIRINLNQLLGVLTMQQQATVKAK